MQTDVRQHQDYWVMCRVKFVVANSLLMTLNISVSKFLEVESLTHNICSKITAKSMNEQRKFCKSKHSPGRKFCEAIMSELTFEWWSKRWFLSPLLLVYVFPFLQLIDVTCIIKTKCSFTSSSINGNCSPDTSWAFPGKFHAWWKQHG